MKPALFTALAVSVLMSPLALAEKAYDLSDREPTVGRTIEATSEEAGKSITKITSQGQLISNEIIDTKNFSIETRQYTKVEDGVVTEYTTRMTESKASKKTQNGDQVKENKDPSPLLNETVTWKLIDDEYVPELPNATEAQLEKLEPKTYSEINMYPEDPVKIGDQWEFDGKEIGQLFDQKVEDADAGKGVFKFAGVEQYKGEACAKIEVSIEIEMAINEPGIDPGTAKLTMKGTLYRSLADRIDVGGDIALKGTTKLKGKTPEGVAFNIDLLSTGTMKGGDKLIKQ